MVESAWRKYDASFFLKKYLIIILENRHIWDTFLLYNQRVLEIIGIEKGDANIIVRGYK